MLGELEKLESNLGGVADMRRQPDAFFIVDLRKEQLAVREARRLGLPVIALVDTNCDPDEADYVIPGNDDAIRSCSLIVKAIADGIEAGSSGCRRARWPRLATAGAAGRPPRRRRSRGGSATPAVSRSTAARFWAASCSSSRPASAGTTFRPPWAAAVARSAGPHWPNGSAAAWSGSRMDGSLF